MATTKRDTVNRESAAALIQQYIEVVSCYSDYVNKCVVINIVDSDGCLNNIKITDRCFQTTVRPAVGYKQTGVYQTAVDHIGIVVTIQISCLDVIEISRISFIDGPVECIHVAYITGAVEVAVGLTGIVIVRAVVA